MSKLLDIPNHIAVVIPIYMVPSVEVCSIVYYHLKISVNVMVKKFSRHPFDLPFFNG